MNASSIGLSRSLKRVGAIVGACVALVVALSQARATEPVMGHVWQISGTGFWNACSSMPGTVTTADHAECEMRHSWDWYPYGTCNYGYYDAEHYASTSAFTGGVRITRLFKATLGCRETWVHSTPGQVSYWEGKGFTQDSRGYYAWDPSTDSARWGLVRVFHVYNSSVEDNYYTQHLTKANSQWNAGYNDTGGSNACPPGEVKDYSTSNNLCVAYVAADGWVKVNVGCSTPNGSNCSWTLTGPGGWTRSGSGSWSSGQLPSHKFEMSCNNISGLTNTSETNYNFSFFTTSNITCTYVCDNQCSSGQKRCSGSGYQTCETNSAGCRVWSSTYSCSDGVPCTSDSCSGSGTCQSTTNNSACEDGNPCTINTCTMSGCSQSYASSSTACSDGDACTQGDYCSGGSCRAGAPMVCNDANPCTNDVCVGGQCVPQPTSGASCSDGDACTLSDVCSNGACVGTPKDCADGNVCTADVCVGGSCQHNAAAGPCDDGDECTTGDQCANKFCVGGAPLACDDYNTCTSDGCNAASGCSHTAISGACSDGSQCTENDQCVAGQCVGGAAPNCNDDNSCTDDSCNPATGCEHADNTALCSDGLQCTTNDRCSGGQCVGALPEGCDDGIPCTVDSCDEAAGCVHTPNNIACADGNPCTDNVCSVADAGCVIANNAASCDDNNPCTTGDTCNSGLCLPGGPTSCDDAVACTLDSCDPVVGCVHTPQAASCDDNIACTTDACDLILGCTHAAVHNSCNDADPCTTDKCEVGTGCVNTPGALTCADGNPCTDDVCTPHVGCQNPNNAAPCDDGDPCTVAEACSAGACAGGIPNACDDANPCTADVCEAGSGNCLHPNVSGACDDENECTKNDTCLAGECHGSAVQCNDGNPCTADSCDPLNGCVTGPADGVQCSDGNPCTLGDVCSNEACLPGAAKPCGDDVACTSDSCDTVTGACINDWTEGCCEADDDCELVQGCSQARCIGHQCQVIPGCVAGDVCVFGGCYGTCDPTKGSTKCGDSGATLYECLTDGLAGASGWIPSTCGGGDQCALNKDTNRFHCCTPNCEGRECGRPSACLASCGTCAEGWACAGPNEELAVDALDPDAFQCVPGCSATADAVDEQAQTWQIAPLPECGAPLPGTVGGAACAPCGGGKACLDGRCEDQCSIAEVTEVGQCSGKVAKWCEDGAPREVDCAQEGSYCCEAGAPGNQIGQATCCSCAAECELKGWQCGINSCNDRCGSPDTDDGCPAGYDCQGRQCVCQIPALCGGAEAEPDADVAGGGGDVIVGADVVEGEGVEGARATPGGGCGDCSGGGSPAPLALSLVVAGWLWVRRRRAVHVARG